VTQSERIAYVRGLFEGLEIGWQDGLIDGQRMQAQKPLPKRRTEAAIRSRMAGYATSIPSAQLKQLVSQELQ